MTFSSFLKLVEIRTKVASLMPFILGVMYTYDRYHVFRPISIGLFFISMICIDMATTAINNFMDYKRALKKEGYNYEVHNAMVRDEISDQVAIATIVVLLGIAIAAGLILFLNTDWVVLFVGIISFAIGVLYSYGPIPISRTPLGELFSGAVMGGFIFFITTYVQIFDEGLIIAYMRGDIFHLHIELVTVLGIFLVAVPLALMISNIMLANNICDVEDDIPNQRYTLPYFLGRQWSLRLYASIYVLAYGALLLAVLLEFLPIANLLVLATVYPIVHNVRQFSAHPDKATTFVLAVKNLILFASVWAISFLISILFTEFL